MKFNKYQRIAERTIAGPNNVSKKDTLIMACLGLAGETGELVDHVKKHAFQGHDLDPDVVFEELGDILWYISAAATAIGVDLRDVAEFNAHKLQERYPDGFDSERSRNR